MKGACVKGGFTFCVPPCHVSHTCCSLHEASMHFYLTKLFAYLLTYITVLNVSSGFHGFPGLNGLNGLPGTKGSPGTPGKGNT